jgi:hypothetical protein
MPLEQEIGDDIDISKSCGCPPLAGHAFLRQRHMCRGGGGGDICFWQGFLPYDAIHEWMMGWMDGWKKLHRKRPRRPLLYVIYLLKHFVFFGSENGGALYSVICCQEQASISKSKMLAEMGVSLFEMPASLCKKNCNHDI